MAKSVDYEPSAVAPEHGHAHSGDETETSTVAETHIVHEKSPDEHPSPINESDDDLEAQRNDTIGHDVEKVATNASRRSVMSRLSRKKTKEKLPPTILPLMDLDNGVVGWESQDDPTMPLNFAPFRKWLMIWLLSAITFMTPWSSSILAPALGQIQGEFHVGSGQ
ncbi:hypothetical protein NLG97_g5468 [Lecanicillium saksenae]|uniref:Uncharacterized protein n=1 Tax=Lecanicillium saksenae TaxID=468837 RepID=A0ACC1QTJ1_9HYPO|nr:hypothetical protein NLG97_g5468 [Lecanicillium saksenae]